MKHVLLLAALLLAGCSHSNFTRSEHRAADLEEQSVRCAIEAINAAPEAQPPDCPKGETR